MVCVGTKAAGNLRIGSAGELEVVTQLQLGISIFLRSREQLPNPLSNFIISQRCRCRRRIVRPSSMGHKAIDLGGSFRGDCRDCIISKPGQPVFQPASKKSMEINHRKACGRLESLFSILRPDKCLVS